MFLCGAFAPSLDPLGVVWRSVDRCLPLIDPIGRKLDRGEHTPRDSRTTLFHPLQGMETNVSSPSLSASENRLS